MNTTPTNQCPQCGQAISGGVRGLCPGCLAMIGFGAGEEVADTVARTGDASASTARPLVNPAVKYFGDYELLEELARGGMGVVFKARQKSLNRVVAVKMILGGRLATEADVKRFRTEAEAAANLQHPNIVAIHEVGEHEGQHYFSMDLVDGPTLAELTRGGPLPAGKAAQYVKAIAEAVQFAHQRGILHRDLKPSNVLVDSQDRVRVTDFGLAKVMHGDSDLTRSGDVMGSPAYMAPEQAQAKRRLIGPPSDVYSLGALLYHLLTGRPPFTGENAVETLRQALDEEPEPPSQHNAKIPADLETICLKCLAKRPEQRYATARDLAEELERFLNYEPILAKPASGWRRAWSWTQKNPWVFAAGFASLVLVFASLAYGFFERTRYLAWHLTTGLESVREADNSPSILFFKALPLVALLLYVSRHAFHRAYGEASRAGTLMPPLPVWLHAGLGLLGIIAGMYGLMLQVKSWAWKLAPPAMLPMEIALLPCAAGLVWLGFYAVWQALGAHEFSRFHGAVNRTVELDLQNAPRRWPVLKVVGFALWLCLLAGGLLAMISTWSELAHGRFLATGLGILVVTGVVALWSVRAVLLRRRLFTHVFAPLAVWLFVSLLVLVGMERHLIAPCAGIVALGFCLALFSVFFTRGPQAADGSGVRRFPVSPGRDAAYGAALFLGLVLALHLVENWRGRREWERVKAELAAQGESLDYASFLKPPVPDDQNVMEHPFMKAHFIKGNPGPGIEGPPFERTGTYGQPYLMEYLKKLPRTRTEAESVVSLVGDTGSRDTIQFMRCPLAAAVSMLGEAAELKIAPAPNTWPWGRFGNRRVWSPTLVTCSFTNATALEALDGLAEKHGFKLDTTRWQREKVLAFVPNRMSLQEMLDWYEQYRSEFNQLEAALRRPYSRLTPNRSRPDQSSIPGFVGFRTAAQNYANLCKTRLLLGQVDAALNDARMLRRLADAVQATEPPTLVEAMIKVALTGLLTHTIEESMAEGLWPERHWEELQRLCEGVDLLAGVSAALRGGERAAILQMVDTVSAEGIDHLLAEFRRIKLSYTRPDDSQVLSYTRLERFADFAIPRGWIDQNKARYAQLLQRSLRRLDAANQWIDLGGSDAEWGEFETSMQGFRPYYILTEFAVANFSRAISTTAKNQTHANAAYLAFALERHRAAKGTYPERLEQLVPDFAAAITKDVFDGQSLRYRRTNDGKYVLWSIGTNEQDDRGVATVDKEGKSNWGSATGDWVWQGVPKQ
jgi:tRNA A-37 threonylcarbamoyl transferase component Bud32